MKILISGSSGLIGSALARFLTAQGYTVARLVRPKTPQAGGDVLWDPEAGTIDASRLEGFDAVVHLAGESIAGGRWTAARKARISDSRVKGTRLLAAALAGLEHRPRVLVSASAMGYYGDRGDEVLREDSPPGTGFLAEVCRAWEQAADPAREKGIRAVTLRTGLVLAGSGGALPRMLPPFKLGIGGVIGSGRQYWSWITLDDLVAVAHHVLVNESVEGPVNVVVPRAVTNREFTETLGRVLSRPTLFPLPGFVARLALGEMANELLLASQRLEPARLVASGFQYRFPGLEPGLRHVLGK
jgi:uncharacterized protein